MIRQCCECKRIWLDGRWVYPRTSELENQDISHGYCEECFIRQMALIRSLGKIAKPKQKKSLNRFFF